MNRPVAETGSAMLNAGGDFIDVAIALEVNWLWGETFVSFDKKPVSCDTHAFNESAGSFL